MNKQTTYLRKNDTVIVVSGREKSKIGKLLRIIPESSRAIVEKVNLVKVHQKPTQNNRQGGIVQKEASIHTSNLMLLCPKCNRGVRIKQKVIENKKIRVCNKCGEELKAVS